MQPAVGWTRRGFSWKILLASCGAALAVLLFLNGANSTVLAAETVATSTLSGTVTVATPAGEPATGAVVVALGSSSHLSATVDSQGRYSLALAPGQWLVSVRPPAPTTSSPSWVFTSTPQLVKVGSTSTTPAGQVLNFRVASASATISGTVLAPDGSTAFAAPNRAYIWAGNQEGQGNSVQVDPVSGQFQVRVLPGNTSVRLALENLAWSPPITLAGTILFADADQITSLTIQTITRTASVSGTVRTKTGSQPVAAVPVRAWRVDGSEVVNGVSDTQGRYSLPLLPGVWSLRADPLPRSGYVPAEPPQTLVLTTGEALSRTLLVATANITVEGRIVNAQGSQIVSDASGLAYALYLGENHPERAPSAEISNGRFRLRLSSEVATGYRVKAFLAPGSGYTALAVADLPALTPGQTLAISIPVAAHTSTISGTFRQKASGLPQLGIPGDIFAHSNSAGVAWTRLNPDSGTYRLNVATTDISGQGGSTWYLRAFVDPSTGFVVQRPRRQAVFLPYNNGQGSSAVADFVVAPIDSTIEGVVLGPRTGITGTLQVPLAGARVIAREQAASGDVPYTRWVHTDRSGRFRLRVAAGTYEVQAFIHRDGLNDRLLAPTLQTLSVTPSQPATGITLTFREATTTISGRVILSGANQAALVRAYSASGASASTLSGRDGRYLLRVNPDDRWYLQAVAAITATNSPTVTFYRSDQLLVTSSTTAVTGQDLVLKPVGTLPEARTFVCEGAESQELALPDGSLIQVPAGALALSGTVYLRAAPLPDLLSDGSAQPISFGYRLLAFDQRGVPIRSFAAPITLVLPYTDAQLAALGVTPSQLIPQYWDEATWSWKPVDDVIVNAGTGGGTVSFSVEHFTDFAVLAVPGSRTSVYVPVAIR